MKQDHYNRKSFIYFVNFANELNATELYSESYKVVDLNIDY